MNPVVEHALFCVFQAYQKLIDETEEEVEHWREFYGRFDTCSLCEAVSELDGADKSPYYKHSCKAHCPLGPRNFKELNDCKKWPSCTGRGSGFDELAEALQGDDLQKIRIAAVKRRMWILERSRT